MMKMFLKPVAAMLAAASLMVFAASDSPQRLPQTVLPDHYQLVVAPDLAAATFAGKETIRVRLTEPSRTITLNAAEIEFRSVTITASGLTHKASVALDAKAEQATLTVPDTIPAGPAEIEIAYAGILNNDLRGLYLSKANNRRYAVTQLEATDARRMFPSFDEPVFKATFALTAIVDAADNAISNGAVVSDTPGPAGKHTITFDTTPKMSTYLVALAVGDFVCTEGRADTVPVRICSTPDKKHLTALALESATQVIQYYNRYYSIDYPFKKLDVVAVPDFSAGAMENTGAIFYRESFLLAERNASLSVRKQINSVLAHEIAHQWFGDLVTMRWWDDIWLNEGFATWAQTKPMKEWKPDWHAELDETQDNQTAMRLDALRATRPIRASATTPAEISALFDPIAYQKGAAVVRMIESWIGEAEFRRAVNAYIERFKYANARADDFWKTLASVTGKPIDKVMPTFVDQPGLPLVNVNISCANGSAMVALSQERYTTGAAAPPVGAGQVWQIPVCLRLPDGKTKCDLLDQKSEAIPVDGCPAWVMANAGARGYYRTAAAPDVVRRIAADVDKLQPAERIAMLSDEWALVEAGRHDVGTFLDLASGFKRERTAAVAQTLVRTLAKIGSELTNDHTRTRYQAWVSSLLSPALAEVGWIATPHEPDDTRALRAAVVSALGHTAHDPAVLAKARELVEQELAKPGSVDATLLNVIVGLAPLAAEATLYDRYLARALKATDPADRYLFLYALASFTDPALVRRTMDLVVGPDVRSQDAKLLVSSMLVAEGTGALAWDLLRERWDEVQKKTGEFVGNTVIVSGLAAFCDAAKLEEIKTFFQTHQLPDAERTLQQSMERIGACVDLSAAQRGKLEAWLSAEK
jgi:puromycin-sensitive aminopeptidase